MRVNGENECETPLMSIFQLTVIQFQIRGYPTLSNNFNVLSQVLHIHFPSQQIKETKHYIAREKQRK